MRYRFPVLTLLLWATFTACGAGAATPVVVGCGSGATDPVAVYAPFGAGPLTLAKVHCLRFPLSNYPVSPPTLSLDGSAVFVFDSVNGLWLAAMEDEPVLQRFDGRVTGLIPGGDLPFAWSEDARSVLGVRQETSKPGGFALGPLKPFLFSVDGTTRQLPDLLSPAGPLDELYWAGQAGMAVAAFGTRGAYYQPEHADPQPTIAFVNARTGQVIQSIEKNAVPGLTGNARTNAVASVMGADGRIHALIAFSPNQWVLWVQGERPQIVPVGVTIWRTEFALSPDGRNVLVMKNLRAFGGNCDRSGSDCSQWTPDTGTSAELRELPSGRLIWSVSGAAKASSSYGVPAISRDGRYALILMLTEDRGPTAALISMETGEVLQEIPSPGMSECAIGFSRDSSAAWISCRSRLVMYDIGP